ncbi:hypothetical protein BU24DRAFT_338904, partial [Aaosphaeria arxii CBS 175.79]
IAIIAVTVFAILIITYLVTTKYRTKKKKKNKQDQLPGWFGRGWWGQQNSRGEYSTNLQDNNELGRGHSRQESVSRETAGLQSDPERQQNETAGVDRNTSVRSVMTLPAYSLAARENERILAREGERGGVDTVVEFPETQEDEEARREQEMDSLYQIRLARRTEAQEREERRQARREARLRGDTQAMAEIRRRTEAAAELSRSQMLIADHQAANRERRVSSVQYGDLGVARHDGTRLRANSTESDNRPLLDSAASISGQSGHSRAVSNNTLGTSHHHRVTSASSVLSVSSRGSDDFEFPDAVHTRSANTSDEFEVVSLSRPRSRSRSRSVSRGATPIPSIDIPREDAPAYEDPPNYESPVTTRAPQLPTIERLPSIQVTPEPTSADGSRQTNPFR